MDIHLRIAVYIYFFFNAWFRWGLSWQCRDSAWYKAQWLPVRQRTQGCLFEARIDMNNQTWGDSSNQTWGDSTFWIKILWKSLICSLSSTLQLNFYCWSVGLLLTQRIACRGRWWILGVLGCVDWDLGAMNNPCHKFGSKLEQVGGTQKVRVWRQFLANHEGWRWNGLFHEGHRISNKISPAVAAAVLQGLA